MFRVFDCSNSSTRPSNRGFGGPVMNEFVALMHKYAPAYGFEFINNANDADIIFTNDVFPVDVRDLGIPMVKRMDGIFWQHDLIHRNHAYNESAMMADGVIFITEYSRNSLKTLYPNEFNQLRNHVVSTHWTDPTDIPKVNISDVQTPTVFVAMATNWNRPEKRVNELIKFASTHDVVIHLIGTTDGIKLPSNIIPHGYLTSSEAVSSVFNQSHAFINLTCKDAATKTVCTAINHGLPVLYAGSGGVGELVQNYGMAIEENDDIQILDHIPQLNPDKVHSGYMKFMNEYSKYKRVLPSVNTSKMMVKALRQYFMYMIHILS